MGDLFDRLVLEGAGYPVTAREILHPKRHLQPESVRIHGLPPIRQVTHLRIARSAPSLLLRRQNPAALRVVYLGLQAVLAQLRHERRMLASNTSPLSGLPISMDNIIHPGKLSRFR